MVVFCEYHPMIYNPNGSQPEISVTITVTALTIWCKSLRLMCRKVHLSPFLHPSLEPKNRQTLVLYFFFFSVRIKELLRRYDRHLHSPIDYKLTLLTCFGLSLIYVVVNVNSTRHFKLTS
jgi:hypothetical protein